MSVEHTLALIKPEGMQNEKMIIDRFKKEGFIVLARRTVHLTPEQVSDLFHDHYGKPDFPLVVASTSVGPVTAVCLGRADAVEKLKEVVGPYEVDSAKTVSPDCLNSQFGNAECNLAAVHASSDVNTARREIHFFFPKSHVEPAMVIEENLRYLDREVRPLLKEGLAQMVKEKPVQPMLWLADWLLGNNPNKPVTKEHLRHHKF